MKDEPLVSVVVPTFNSEQFLERCLRSIRVQTYGNIEVIVVDNYSTDKTKEIAEKYQAKTISSGAKRSEARNIGAKEAEGKYLFFVDSDMELGASVVDECLRKVDIGYDVIIVPEVSIGKGFWAECRALEKRLYVGDDTIEAARFFRKCAFDGVGGYDLELDAGEDWDLNIRIKNSGIRAGRISAEIKHNEGRLSLREAAKKKQQYGKIISSYWKKHPKEASQQLRLIRPAFLRNWRGLLGDPVHFVGLFFLKFCEFTVGGIAYTVGIFSHS